MVVKVFGSQFNMEKTALQPEDAALKFLSEMKDKSQKIEVQIGLQTICVLGNHEEHLKEMEQIVKSLKDSNYPAVHLKGIPQEVKLSDYLVEKTVIKKSSVILVIDNPKGGVVGECTYIMENPELADKTIMLVPEDIHEDDIFSLVKHYLHFPVKVRFNKAELVNIAVKAAKQATHRLAERVITKNNNGVEKNGV